MTDTTCDAIEKLFIEEVLGARVWDAQKPHSMPLRDQYVGLLDFASLVLWALEVRSLPSFFSKINLVSFVSCLVCGIELQNALAEAK